MIMILSKFQNLNLLSNRDSKNSDMTINKKELSLIQTIIKVEWLNIRVTTSFSYSTFSIFVKSIQLNSSSFSLSKTYTNCSIRHRYKQRNKLNVVLLASLVNSILSIKIFDMRNTNCSRSQFFSYYHTAWKYVAIILSMSLTRCHFLIFKEHSIMNCEIYERRAFSDEKKNSQFDHRM